MDLVLVAFFVIVFVVSYRSLVTASWFGRTASAVLAFCVASMSVLGLGWFGHEAPRQAAPESIVLFPVLLLYAAFGLALVVLLILAILVPGIRRSPGSTRRATRESAVEGTQICGSKAVGHVRLEKNIRRFRE
jgi:hypothetical protein